MARRDSTIFAIAVCAVAAWPANTLAQGVPDLSNFWNHGIPQIVFQPPPEGGPGPVIDVQDVQCTPKCPPRPAGRFFIGDTSNPILKPNAAAAVKAMGDRWRAGEIVNAATEICFPSGVPHILTLIGPMQILQTKDQVTFLYQRDHQVRRVDLNRPHSAKPAPSWYGESVGHYEDGALVVDTIGLNNKAIIDRFGAPQTETTHVVERYSLVNNGAALLVHVTVDDSATFTMPWSGTVTFTRVRNLDVMPEEICAENDRDPITKSSYPIPMAADKDRSF